MDQSGGYYPGINTIGHSKYTNADPVSHPSNTLKANNQWATIFGAPEHPIEVKPYDRTNRSTWIMPEAYRGQSTFLSNTMTLVAMANNSFILTTIFPIVRTDGALQSNWSRWEFPSQLPTVVPERGVVRIVRSNRIEGSQSMRRYGIGVFLEHGFLFSPLGRQHYLMHMKQINESVSEGLQFQGLYAIYTVGEWAKRYLKENGDEFAGEKINGIMLREKKLWACLQTNEQAMNYLDNIINESNQLYNYGTQLTTYLMDRRVANFLSIVPQDQTKYYMRGPGAHSLVRDGPDAFTRTERGDVIFVTRGYNADENGPISPCEQPTSIGEFLDCSDKSYGSNYEHYTSEDRNVQYYDEGTDRWEIVTLRDMLDNCHRFDENGDIIHINSLKHPSKRFDQFEIDADFLHRRDEKGNLVTVKMFGQIDEHHINAHDYICSGRSASYELSRKTQIPHGQTARLLQKLNSVIKRMTSIKFTAQLNNLLRQIARSNPSSISKNQRSGGLGQWTSNSYGSMDLPVAPTGYANTFNLPPTHLSWGGFQVIAEASRNGTIVTKGFNENDAKVVEEFVDWFELFVPKVMKYYPDSILLKPQYADSWIENPTPHDTAFANLVLQGVPVHPVFLRMPVVANNNNPSSNLTQGAADTISTLENEFNLGFQARSIITQSLTGNMTTARSSTNAASFIGAGINTTAGDNGQLFFSLKQYDDNGTLKEIKPNNTGSAGFNSFAKLYFADAGINVNGNNKLAFGPTPSNNGTQEQQNYANTFKDLVRWAMLLRVPTSNYNFSNKKDIKKIVRAFAGITMALVSISIIRIDNSNKQALYETMGRVRKLLDALESIVSIQINGTNGPPYDAIAAFDNSDIFQKFEKTIVQFYTQNQNYISQNVKVSQIADMFREIKNQYDESFGSAIKKLSITDTNNPSDRNSSIQTKRAIDELYAQLNVERNIFVRSPLVMSSGQITTFMDYLVNNINGAGNKTQVPTVYGWPSGSDNTLQPITPSELFDSTNKFKVDNFINTRTIANAGPGASLSIGAVFQRDKNSIAQSIAHSAMVRSALENENINSNGLPRSTIGSNIPNYHNSLINDSSSLIDLPDSNPIGAHMHQDYGQSSYINDFRKKQLARNNDATKVGTKRLRDIYSYGNKTSEARRNMFLNASKNDKKRRLKKLDNIKGSGDFGGSAVTRMFLDREFTENFTHLFAKISAKSHGLERMCALIALTTPVTKHALEATITHNIVHLFNYILNRPHARYNGITVTKLKPGLETGRTNLAHVKVEQGSDPTTGVFHSNLIYYSSTDIVNDKNISNNPNALIVRYNGGLGSGFFKNDGSYSPTQNMYGRNKNDSFFSYAIPRQEKVGTIISTNGKINHLNSYAYDDEEHNFSGLTYSTAAFYTRFWGYEKHRFNSPLDDSMYDRYTNERAIPNAISYQSYAAYYSSKLGKFTQYTTQTGHWPLHTVYPGAAAARVAERGFDNRPYHIHSKMTQI